MQSLALYLGRPVSALLAEQPFVDWDFEKSVDSDVDDPRLDYVFVEDGLDLICDLDHLVRTIIIYASSERMFTKALVDLPLDSTRDQVITWLGQPEKSGPQSQSPLLGRNGAWDRFAMPTYSIHVAYRPDSDQIEKITLMRADVVP